MRSDAGPRGANHSARRKKYAWLVSARKPAAGLDTRSAGFQFRRYRGTFDIISDAFSSLNNCCYMRKATMDGIEGYVLLDCDGEVEFFTDTRSSIFFHAAKHELVIVQPN